MVCDNITSIAYAESKWLAAWLPIIYNIHSYKWPLNTFDTTDTITTIVNNNGNARITLSSTVETYIQKEYIKISGASDESYNGVWQILQKHSSTEFTLNAAFTATDTASFQRYYNNYHIVIRVYVGIRSGHVLESNDPISLSGSLQVKPNSSNDALLDISSQVRENLSRIENDLCTAISASNGWMGNDTKMWTSFYISYAESYDTSDGSTVSTFTSSFTDDMRDSYDLAYFYAANGTHQFQHFQGRSYGEFAIQDISIEDAVAKWMTPFEEPIYFTGNEWDLSIIVAYEDEDYVNEGFFVEYVLTEYDESGNQLFTETVAIDREDEGLYRFAFSEYPFASNTKRVELFLQKDDEEKLSETKTVWIEPGCTDKIYLRWLNPSSGWDGWLFNKRNDKGIRVEDRKIVRRNIFEDFDNEFVNGTEQDDYYSTTAYETRRVRSQLMTKQQLNAMKGVQLSNKVIEIFQTTESGCARFKYKTVLVDPNTFNYEEDGNGFYKVSFAYRHTDQIQLQGQ